LEKKIQTQMQRRVKYIFCKDQKRDGSGGLARKGNIPEKTFKGLRFGHR